MNFLPSTRVADFTPQRVVHLYNGLRSSVPSLPEKLTADQVEAVSAVLRKQDLLCVLPTGSGKTLAMILPAVILSHVNEINVSTNFKLIYSS